MAAGIILVPYLYLLLPLWVVAGLLIVGALTIFFLLWEPLLRVRALVWLAALALVAADLWAAGHFGTTSNGFFITNNLVLLALAVGLTNLWAQSGMRARDVTILGAVLALYDLTATWLLPLMNDVMGRLAGLPLSPTFGWAVDSISSFGAGRAGTWVGIGLGDLLMASLFPLVMRKAFGRLAGIAAILLTLSALAVTIMVPIATIFPVMIVYGPLMVVQYIFWPRKLGSERTTWQYLQAEPL